MYHNLVRILVYSERENEMRMLSLSEAKTKLSELVEAVGGTDERVIITKHGRPAAVLISPEEYDSWQETTALRDRPAFKHEIQAGLRALRENRAAIYTLEELFEESE